MSAALRVVCQGERGACAHGAGRFMFPDADVAPQPSVQQALEALIEGSADYALLPASNTRTGGFTEALALLARSDLHIVAEVWREIRLRVVAPRRWVLGQRADFEQLNDAEKAQVRSGLLASLNEIYSDQPGFAQYDSLLKHLAPRAKHRVTGCTGEAARLVHQADRAAEKPEKIPNIAALASEEAARMYDLVSLSGNGPAPGAVREGDADNATLFYVVARRLRFNPPQEKRAWYGFSVLMGQERLRRFFKPGELEMLFQDEELARRLETRKSAIGMDTTLYALEIERERANVLFEALLETGSSQVRQIDRLVRKLGGGSDMARRAEAAERAVHDTARDRQSWEGGDDDGAVDVLRCSKDVKSILALRAKPSDTDGQTLMRVLFEGGPGDVRVRLLALLPPLNDGTQGMGFVIEIDGYLASDTKKKSSGFYFRSRGTPPERLLSRVMKESESVRIMGSVPRTAFPGHVEAVKAGGDEKGHWQRWRLFASLIAFAAIVGGALYFIAVY